MPDPTCATCGVPFVQRPTGKPKRYCCRRCKEIAAAERKRERYVPEMFPCTACGTPCRRFGTRAFCGADACRVERDRTLRQAAYARNPGASYQRHRHKWRVYNARRQARLDVQTIPGGCSEERIAGRFAFWGNACWICGGDAQERDHVKPLAKGGLHLPCNIRPICRSCNRRKKDTWPVPTGRRHVHT